MEEPEAASGNAQTEFIPDIYDVYRLFKTKWPDTATLIASKKYY